MNKTIDTTDSQQHASESNKVKSWFKSCGSKIKSLFLAMLEKFSFTLVKVRLNRAMASVSNGSEYGSSEVKEQLERCIDSFIQDPYEGGDASTALRRFQMLKTNVFDRYMLCLRKDCLNLDATKSKVGDFIGFFDRILLNIDPTNRMNFLDTVIDVLCEKEKKWAAEHAKQKDSSDSSKESGKSDIQDFWQEDSYKSFKKMAAFLRKIYTHKTADGLFKAVGGKKISEHLANMNHDPRVMTFFARQLNRLRTRVNNGDIVRSLKRSWSIERFFLSLLEKTIALTVFLALALPAGFFALIMISGGAPIALAVLFSVACAIVMLCGLYYFFFKGWYSECEFAFRVRSDMMPDLQRFEAYNLFFMNLCRHFCEKEEINLLDISVDDLVGKLMNRFSCLTKEDAKYLSLSILTTFHENYASWVKSDLYQKHKCDTDGKFDALRYYSCRSCRRNVLSDVHDDSRSSDIQYLIAESARDQKRSYLSNSIREGGIYDKDCGVIEEVLFDSNMINPKKLYKELYNVEDGETYLAGGDRYCSITNAIKEAEGVLDKHKQDVGKGAAMIYCEGNNHDTMQRIADFVAKHNFAPSLIITRSAARGTNDNAATTAVSAA